MSETVVIFLALVIVIASPLLYTLLAPVTGELLLLIRDEIRQRVALYRLKKWIKAQPKVESRP